MISILMIYDIERQTTLQKLLADDTVFRYRIGMHSMYSYVQ